MEAYQAMKPAIVSASVLTYFDRSKDHYIQTDASQKGLEAVLLQFSQPVVYNVLCAAEQRYSNIEWGFLGIVFVLERLHCYVYSNTVTVETDHKPLVSIWKRLSHLSSSD